MGEKTKRLLSILVVVCMVVMNVVNMQEVRVSADEPVTYEYYDDFGNPVIGTCSDYSVVGNVVTDATNGVASGSAISVASGGAISVVSGGAISVVSGGAISVASGGAISVVSGGAIGVLSGGAINVASGGDINSAVILDGSKQPWYVAEGEITIPERIKIVSGTAVNLILKDGCILNASKGINVPEGSALSIFGQGGDNSTVGQLIATGDFLYSGIGGGKWQSGGTVTINGGRITASGGGGGAGIGGGTWGSGGFVTINGGTVVSVGGGGGAGIGGGNYYGDGGSVTINGGRVVAIGGHYGAGIGGGWYGDGGTIIINNAELKATGGGDGGAGIGAGRDGSTGSIIVNDGMNVYASSDETFDYCTVSNGITADRKYVVAYPEHSGIMSASGNIITATCVDMMGMKCDIDLSISALTEPLFGGSELKVVSLDNLDYFNYTLGKSGDDAVSESHLKYYNSDGELLESAPKTAGYYTAKLTVDGVTASLDYYANINPPVQYETSGSFRNPVYATCSDYTVVTGGALNWGGDDRHWYVAHGDVYISDLVTVTGSVNLILMDGCTLNADRGINVANGASLNIFAQGLGERSLGRLNAYGDYGQAGIGGGEYELPGNISIYGGHISTYGGMGAAGIGGGYNSVGTGAGTIAIIGGEVTADGGYVDTMGDPTMPATGGYDFASAIGAGYNGGYVPVIYNTALKAFTSSDYWQYSPVSPGNAGNGRSALAYPEHSAILSMYGSTIYATYVDEYGYRCSTQLTVKEPSEVFGYDETKKVIVENLDSFNTSLGKTGSEAVSESQIRYYTRDGVELSAVPIAEGLYTAKINIDSIVITLDYDIAYTYVRPYDTYWDGSSRQCFVVAGQREFSDRIWVNGTVNLVLLSGCKLTATKGINVGWGSTLNIYNYDNYPEMPTGELYAHGFDYQAGIGGDYYGDGGTIVIYGGDVEATGGCYAAGIGGGYGGYGGTITINGGNVTAEGGIQGAGIGGGRYWGNDGDGYSYGGNITINGGNVTASAGDGASGIGGGRGCSAGTVRITGGNVHATGHEAGIGGGAFGPGGDITITGGSIVAEGATNYAGIGINTNRYRGIINIASDMKAFSSINDTVYTQFYREGSNIGRYVLVYKENSGVMSASGNTITATYIDQNGSKQSVSTSITAPPALVYGDPEDICATLSDIDNFNSTFGWYGEDAVSASQIKYYTEGNSALPGIPSATGGYIARLTVDGVTALLEYYTKYNPIVTYEYYDNSLNPHKASLQGYKVVKNTTTTIDEDLNEWYIVNGYVYLPERLNVSGSVNLVLMDGAVLTASKGINVASGSDLTIFGQDHESENPGCLYAYGNSECAGIGSSAHENAGSITINGGVITAEGGYSGAGIGGGSYGNGGITTINGGRVTATGGDYGAGIGGGDWRTDAGNIIINGGRITATGAYSAAGIGGGWEGTGGNISINGGQIVATAGSEYSGAGIGGGSSHETICNISVGNGMKVYASANQNSGYTAVTTGNTPGGRYALAYREHSGVMNVSGNTITATYVDPSFNRTSVNLILTAPTNHLYGINSCKMPTLTNLDLFNSVLDKTGSYAVTTSMIIYYKANGQKIGKVAPTYPGSYVAKITVDGVTAVLNYNVVEAGYTSVTDNDTVWTGTPDDCFVVRGHFGNIHRITVSGTVNLVLLEGSELTLSRGITVTEGSTLNIYGQKTNWSCLIVNGEANKAAIGGGDHENAGTINIYDGKIIATGGSNGAGIGGGNYGSGGNVNIYGGLVTATGGYSGAGIGGGSYGSGGNVNIYGGNVAATGGTYGAGIGGGDWSGAGGNITINGGTVLATGGQYGGAGIGGGWDGNGGTFTINDGSVTANGGHSGAGIGGGVNGAGGIINFNGGAIVASGGDDGGAGIGAGSDGTPGTLTLAQGMRAFASASENLGYTEIYSGTTSDLKYVTAYEE